MVGPFPGVPYSFGALRQTYGPLLVRRGVCWRYAPLYLAEIGTPTTNENFELLQVRHRWSAGHHRAE